MKVLILCNYPLNPSNMNGGTSTVSYNLVESLMQYTDISITVFSFVNRIVDKEIISKNNNKLKIYKVYTNFKFSNVLNYYFQRMKFRHFLDNNEFDIIHAQSNSLYATLSIDSGLPNVFTDHGLRLREIELNKNRDIIRYYLNKKNVLKNYRNAKNIIQTNVYTRNETKIFHKAKTWIIPNPIDENYFKLYKKYKINIGHILLIGGIRRRKDIVTAIQSIRNVLNNHINIFLNIIGPIEKDYKQEIENLIVKFKLSQKIKIYGLVSYSKLLYLTAKADILLLTSIEETSPLAIMQSMAAGKPIVSTDVGGIPEIVIENKNALLSKPKDHCKIAKHLAYLILNRDKREAFSKNSFLLAQKKFSAKQVSSETLRVYNEIIKNFVGMKNDRCQSAH